MNEKIDALYELCETISREIEECNEKIRSAGGKLTSGDVDYIDKLTHTLKSIKTTIAMMEADDGYSNGYMPFGMSYQGGGGQGGNTSNRGGGRGGNSNRGNSYEGSSYARGRNARRDSMGRYSRDGGYSYADSLDSMIEEMRGMMSDLPAEKQQKVQRIISEMERV